MRARKMLFAAVAATLMASACTPDSPPPQPGPVKEVPCPDPKHLNEPCR